MLDKLHGEQPDLPIIDCRSTLARLVVLGGVRFLRDGGVGSNKPVARSDSFWFVIPYLEDRDFDLWACDEVREVRVISVANVKASTDL